MIAIVIPYYKKAFFKATLESLTQQTSKEFKVYIGNDGSTENPEDLIKEYSNKLNLKYEKFNENLGHKSLVKHWERCLSLVNNEEWVTILGDDDVYEPKVIEFFYKNIEKISEGEIDVIRYATKKIDENGDTISSVYYHPTIESSLDFFF
jgi:glycosyltransferase involved in cell wall biosynthesis